MSISVVVCARNEKKYIKNCLECLKKQTVKPEIIVVDGNSTDRTFEIAKRYADKVVRDNNKGIADARNLGWKIAKGDVIAYCDADCLPPKNWVEKISKYMDGNLGIYGPQIPYDAGIKRQITFKVWQHLFIRIASYFNYPVVCAANSAFKKSALKRFPFRLKVIEDFDVGNRMRHHGKVKFCKDLYMFTSARRFKRSFTFIGVKDYLFNYFRLKLGYKEADNYWK